MTGYDSRSWVMLRIARQAVQSHKRRSRSMKRIKFVGLDVLAETIAVAVAEQDGEVRTVGVIPNREESIRKLVKRLGPVEQLRFCYEAGPTGYVVYWQLAALGAQCEVVAPTLVPVKRGERVKTDRRDALKLARNYRGGELTPVWVPDAAHEGLRDLVRAREAAKKDQLRARHRLGKFLLRHGRRPEGLKAWTKKYLEWIKTHVHFDEAAQEITLADYLEEVDHLAARIDAKVGCGYRANGPGRGLVEGGGVAVEQRGGSGGGGGGKKKGENTTL